MLLGLYVLLGCSGITALTIGIGIHRSNLRRQMRRRQRNRQSDRRR